MTIRSVHLNLKLCMLSINCSMRSYSGFRNFSTVINSQILLFFSPKLTNLLIEFINKQSNPRTPPTQILQLFISNHNPCSTRGTKLWPGPVRPWITRECTWATPPLGADMSTRPPTSAWLSPILTLSPWTQFSTVYVCERTWPPPLARPHFPLRRSLSSPLAHTGQHSIGTR